MVYYFAFIIIFSIIIVLTIIFKFGRKLKTTLLILSSLLLLASLVFATRPIIISNSNSLSDETLALSISQGYFNYCRAEPIYTIDDFEIISANKKEAQQDISVSYNVKPSSYSYTDWDTGSGHKEENGWLNGKSGDLKYVKILDLFLVF